MSSRMNPYNSFVDNAREAMTFYQDGFGGELHINTFGEYGQAGTPVENLVMHATVSSTAGASRCRSSPRCGATRWACAPTDSASPGWSTSRALLPWSQPIRAAAHPVQRCFAQRS